MNYKNNNFILTRTKRKNCLNLKLDFDKFNYEY